MARTIEDVRCPFCGTGVPYGLALCRDCDADVSYDVRERRGLSGQAEADLDKLQIKTERALKDAKNAPWPFRSWAIKDANKRATEFQTKVDTVVDGMNAAVDRRIARGDTTSIVTFAREGRDIDVKIRVPLDPDAKVDFDVILIDHHTNKVNVTAAVRRVTKLGMGPSIRLVDAIPSTVLSGVSETEAKNARVELEAAGASVEVR